jgi:amino acid transporter
MQTLSRALYWLSIIFMFVSLSIPAVLLQNQDRDLLDNAVILAAFVGGLLVTFIGLGISELLGAWARASGDLRAIRKATLGH